MKSLTTGARSYTTFKAEKPQFSLHIHERETTWQKRHPVGKRPFRAPRLDRRIRSAWMLKKDLEYVDWNWLTQDGVKWRSHLTTIKKLKAPPPKKEG
jgi:hypothetical protein